VIGANATAVDDEGWDAVFRSHEWNHFLEDVGFVLPVAIDADRWRNGLAVEAFGVKAIYAEESDIAAGDGVTESVH
jgi:hypothetical protein